MVVLRALEGILWDFKFITKSQYITAMRCDENRTFANEAGALVILRL